jgi:hypothetical protein
MVQIVNKMGLWKKNPIHYHRQSSPLLVIAFLKICLNESTPAYVEKVNQIFTFDIVIVNFYRAK